MPITGLKFNNVGPFDEIEFEFDEHVNVFVGPNNSGKSTALMVLADVVAYPFRLPEKIVRGPNSRLQIDVREYSEPKSFSGSVPYSLYRERMIPELSDLFVGILKGIGYTTFVPALRRSTDFRSEGPTIRQENTNIPFKNISPELRKRRALISTNASLISDEAIIQKIIELDYRAYRRDKPSLRKIIDKIATMASEITEGFPIEFIHVEEDKDGLFPQFSTPDGDVPLDVLSQGTQSIIQ